MSQLTRPLLAEDEIGVRERSEDRSEDRPRDGGFAGVAHIAVGVVASAVAAIALGRRQTVRTIDVVALALIVTWATTAVVVGRRRPTDRVGMICGFGAAVGALALAAGSFGTPEVGCVWLGLLPAAALHMLAGLPTGRLRTTRRRVAVGVGYLVGGAAGALSIVQPVWPLVVMWFGAIAAGLHFGHRTYVTSGQVDRRRMQWVAWAMASTAELVLVVGALWLMTRWPPAAGAVALAAVAVVPVSLVAASHDRTIARVDRLLTNTVALAGLTAVVIAAYLGVIVVIGHELDDHERALLLASMAIAVIAALIYQPLRNQLTNTVNQLVYGARNAPDDALRTWGSRLTRAIPLDELLLQLAESLRKSMSLASASIYTGGDGRYELAAAVPHVDAPALLLGEQERAVVARAGVTGGSWLDVWMPHLAGANSANTRVAPIVHADQLLGMIVMTRAVDADAFRSADALTITELARQVGLALHNVQLDSALQASLDELQLTNVELQKSRLRIVSAGDQERRKLERNLHDGAQQHLVAMAVKLRMVEELLEDAPAEARKVVEELRDNLKDTITELRALAHGIFPPLLSSGGLREALPAAAGRASLPTTVETVGVGRYAQEIEAAIYFCCLEAMQNACKHAGSAAEIAVEVVDCDGQLRFRVSDTGAGFDATSPSVAGHGFVNMQDRLGAVGGRLVVESRAGIGSSIQGEIPLRGSP